MHWGSRNRKRPASNAAVLFLFIGLVFTVLLAAFVLQQNIPQREAIQEATVSEFGPLDALPDGVTVKEGALIEVFAAQVPTYIVGFSRGNEAELGLVEFDITSGKFRLISRIRLLGVEGSLLSVSSVLQLDLGPGAPTVILVGGSTASAYMDGVMIVLQEGKKLRLVDMQTEHKAVIPAMFLSGASARNSSQFSMKDINDDGIDEAVVAVREFVRGHDGESEYNEEVRVYVWDRGMLRFDDALSWAMTMSNGLFPKPEAEAVLDEGER